MYTKDRICGPRSGSNFGSNQLRSSRLFPDSLEVWAKALTVYPILQGRAGVAPRARPLPIQWSCYCFSGDKLVEIVIGPLPAPTYLDPLASVFLSFSGQGSK